MPILSISITPIEIVNFKNKMFFLNRNIKLATLIKFRIYMKDEGECDPSKFFFFFGIAAVKNVRFS